MDGLKLLLCLGHVVLECLQQHDAVADVVQGLWGHVQSGWSRVREGKGRETNGRGKGVA